MTIKEFPLIKAASNPDAIPNIFVSHPIIAGFFSLLTCALLGAILVAFPIISTNEPLFARFETIRFVAIFGVGVGYVIQLGIALSGVFIIEEAETRIPFAFGGWIAFAVLGVLDQFAFQQLRILIERNIG